MDSWVGEVSALQAKWGTSTGMPMEMLIITTVIQRVVAEVDS
jgi:hypothetical protein